MKTNLIAATFVAALILTGGHAAEHAAAPASHGAHWSYQGATGPAHWAELDPAWTGREQSPVDLTTGAAPASDAPKLVYGKSSLHIMHQQHVTGLIDNGHTIQADVDAGSTLTTARGTYQLKQFHFHAPSEHTIDGRSFPLEVHFVHQGADGHLAVVGVLFTEGAANANLAKLIARFPAGPGQSSKMEGKDLDLELQLPGDWAAFSYPGSLTTPPCSEGVEWYVFRTPVTASREQLAAFAARLGPTNRPVQPLNGRTISLVKLGHSEAGHP